MARPWRATISCRAVVMVSIALAVALVAQPAAGLDPDGFSSARLKVARTAVMDIGVADVDDDGLYDIFTTNHNDLQSLLINIRGRYRERLTSLGLDHTVAFPGWEDSRPPTFDRDGLFLYRTPGAIVVDWRPAVDGTQASGSIEFLTTVAVDSQTNMVVTVTEEPHPSAPVLTTVEFTATGPATLKLDPEVLSAPVHVSLDAALDPSGVYVGARKVNPISSSFTVLLRDRHGMAWADYDGDGDTDLFIGRGGLKGTVDEYGGLIQDELMQRGSSSFTDVTGQAGIDKEACRTRQAAWVDLYRDGLLDLFISCEGAPPQLYRQDPVGVFSDVSLDLGASGVEGDPYAWVDVDGDLAPELVTFADGQLVVHAHDGFNPFSLRQVVNPGFTMTRPSKITFADLGNDGDPDLFVTAGTSNALFENVAGSFQAVAPTDLGLPQSSLTASWVDYDNDGRVDLHTVPDGLFRQQTDGSFAKVPVPLLEFPSTALLGAATWFDRDNDGTRDALLGAQLTGANWTVRLVDNLAAAANHWLAVDLVGPALNRQAIGAVVRVTVDDVVHTGWVGESEGSQFSQGHYRVYFGLGPVAAADQVEVTWPDGSVQQLGRPAGDELVEIAYAS